MPEQQGHYDAHHRTESRKHQDIPPPTTIGRRGGRRDLFEGDGFMGTPLCGIGYRPQATLGRGDHGE